MHLYCIGKSFVWGTKWLKLCPMLHSVVKFSGIFLSFWRCVWTAYSTFLNFQKTVNFRNGEIYRFEEGIMLQGNDAQDIFSYKYRVGWKFKMFSSKRLKHFCNIILQKAQNCQHQLWCSRYKFTYMRRLIKSTNRCSVNSTWLPKLLCNNISAPLNIFERTSTHSNRR